MITLVSMHYEADKRIKKNSHQGTLVDQNQIIQTNIIEIVWQIVRRITDEILGVKGLRQKLRNSRNSNVLRMRTAFLVVAVFVM